MLAHDQNRLSLAHEPAKLGCYALLSVVQLGRCNVDATVDDLAVVFGH
jgi:hypothetical protein